jgi:hypothetical protein
MDDEGTLAFLREQAAHARCVFSVCTGALLLGAAGLLKGRKATTHWASFHLLPYFGAVPVNERVVKDGKLVTTAGVTAGLEGALQRRRFCAGSRPRKPSSWTCTTRRTRLLGAGRPRARPRRCYNAFAPAIEPSPRPGSPPPDASGPNSACPARSSRLR